MKLGLALVHSCESAVSQQDVVLVASGDAAEGSLLIHQDARIFLSSLDESHRVQHFFVADSQRASKQALVHLEGHLARHHRQQGIAD